MVLRTSSRLMSAKRRDRDPTKDAIEKRTGRLTESKLVNLLDESDSIRRNQCQVQVQASSSSALFKVYPYLPLSSPSSTQSSSPYNLVKFTITLFERLQQYLSSLFNLSHTSHIISIDKMAQNHKPKPPLDVLQSMVNGIVSFQKAFTMHSADKR